MTACLYVGMGGFIGSVLRYLFGLIPFKDYTWISITDFIY